MLRITLALNTLKGVLCGCCVPLALSVLAVGQCGQSLQLFDFRVSPVLRELNYILLRLILKNDPSCKYHWCCAKAWSKWPLHLLCRLLFLVIFTMLLLVLKSVTLLLLQILFFCWIYIFTASSLLMGETRLNLNRTLVSIMTWLCNNARDAMVLVQGITKGLHLSLILLLHPFIKCMSHFVFVHP